MPVRGFLLVAVVLSVAVLLVASAGAACAYNGGAVVLGGGGCGPVVVAVPRGVPVSSGYVLNVSWVLVPKPAPRCMLGPKKIYVQVVSGDGVAEGARVYIEGPWGVCWESVGPRGVAELDVPVGPYSARVAVLYDRDGDGRVDYVAGPVGLDVTGCVCAQFLSLKLEPVSLVLPAPLHASSKGGGVGLGCLGGLCFYAYPVPPSGMVEVEPPRGLGFAADMEAAVNASLSVYAPAGWPPLRGVYSCRPGSHGKLLLVASTGGVERVGWALLPRGLAVASGEPVLAVAYGVELRGVNASWISMELPEGIADLLHGVGLEPPVYRLEVWNGSLPAGGAVEAQWGNMSLAVVAYNASASLRVLVLDPYPFAALNETLRRVAAAVWPLQPRSWSGLAAHAVVYIAAPWEEPLGPPWSPDAVVASGLIQWLAEANASHGDPAGWLNRLLDSRSLVATGPSIYTPLAAPWLPGEVGWRLDQRLGLALAEEAWHVLHKSGYSGPMLNWAVETPWGPGVGLWWLYAPGAPAEPGWSPAGGYPAADQEVLLHVLREARGLVETEAPVYARVDGYPVLMLRGWAYTPVQPETMDSAVLLHILNAARGASGLREVLERRAAGRLKAMGARPLGAVAWGAVLWGGAREELNASGLLAVECMGAVAKANAAGVEGVWAVNGTVELLLEPTGPGPGYCVAVTAQPPKRPLIARPPGGALIYVTRVHGRSHVWLLGPGIGYVAALGPATLEPPPGATVLYAAVTPQAALLVIEVGRPTAVLVEATGTVEVVAASMLTPGRLAVPT